MIFSFLASSLGARKRFSILVRLSTTMNFFERQDQARTLTVRLVVLFIVALLALFFLMHSVGAVLWGATFDSSPSSSSSSESSDVPFSNSSEDLDYGKAFCDPVAITVDFFIVAGFVLLGTMWKLGELKSLGVDGVAQSLGGRQVFRGSQKPWERRLYNVVEEMAIASGSPVPNVYIMDSESSINACAFGDGPESAGICVTKGALDQLTRDELQGVIGHEFSHIVNRDVKLNMRLVGILFGIEIIAMLAMVGMRSIRLVAFTSSSSKKDSGGVIAVIVAIFFICLALFIIGSVGLFFGNMIRAAISRQREYLADASSMQFTRNPSGLANALKKIGCPTVGSHIQSPKSVEMSHLFFGSVFSGSFWGSLFQTHPPLVKRIQAIEPSFDGRLPLDLIPNRWEREDSEPPAMGFAQSSSRPKSPAQPQPANAAPKTASTGVTHALDSRAIYGDWVDSVEKEGSRTEDPSAPKPQGLQVASRLLQSTPSSLNALINNPIGAKGVFFALLSNVMPETCRRQCEIIDRVESNDVRAVFYHAMRETASLSDSTKLVIMRMATPSMKQMSRDDYLKFRENVVAFCNIDGRIDLFEYAALAAVIREMDVFYKLSAPPTVRYKFALQVEEQIKIVLWFLACEGELNPGDAERAYRASVGLAEISDSLPADKRRHLREFTLALNTLVETSPTVKEKILQACYRCVAYDGVVTEREAASISAITAALNVPAPIWSDWI